MYFGQTGTTLLEFIVHYVHTYKFESCIRLISTRIQYQSIPTSSICQVTHHTFVGWWCVSFPSSYLLADRSSHHVYVDDCFLSHHAFWPSAEPQRKRRVNSVWIFVDWYILLFLPYTKSIKTVSIHLRNTAIHRSTLTTKEQYEFHRNLYSSQTSFFHSTHFNLFFSSNKKKDSIFLFSSHEIRLPFQDISIEKVENILLVLVLQLPDCNYY